MGLPAKKDQEEEGLTLEAPLEITSSSIGGDSLLDPSLRDLSAKVSALEFLLNLSVKDCKFKDFIREILIQAIEQVRSEAGSILEVNATKNALFFRAITGRISDQLASVEIPVGQGIVGYVAESRKALVVNQTDENKLHLKTIDKVTGFQTRNVIAVPIFVRGEIYGVLELVNKIGEADYSESDLDVLKYYCEMAAKAIEIRMMLAWVKKQ